MNIVVDCSFIISAILPDERKDSASEIYNRFSEGMYEVYAPAIFHLECNNVLLYSIKRKRIDKIQYDKYIRLLSMLPITIDKFCTMPESLHIIGKIATEHNLTSYDASYLELTTRIGASIATLDKNLAISCKKSNLELLLE